MESTGSILERYKKNLETVKAPPHEKAASVNAIVKLLGNNKVYNYQYWLRKVGDANYSDVLDILKKASTLPKKYNLGGFITNELKPYAVHSVKPKSVGGDGRGGSKLSKQGGRVEDSRVPEVASRKGSDSSQS